MEGIKTSVQAKEERSGWNRNYSVDPAKSCIWLYSEAAQW